ncbi:Amiloride-sensitive sodium channel subunit alpha [Acipenser ruthenus]|uniref:Amiloride-sensitive sodium channel subunit alpha n=1 Tax=Acipenser ruthenus TaxID=7906 RepID=A0A662YM17_ACIRT|nr:Amiloride-sensitive sodium channel subunit alpha [Acipenser ruthenus]
MSYCQKASLRRICRETLTHTTAHGISSILRSKSTFQKNCWIVFVIFVVTCMLWQCSELIIAFFQYPSQERITLVNNSKLKFPAVTFCNLNRVRKSLLNSKYSFLKKELPFLDNDFGSNLTSYTENDHEYSYSLDYALSKLSIENQAEAGQQLEDMLLSCKFHGSRCDKSFFSTFLHHKFGNCYTFNSLTKMGSRGQLMRREVLNATKAGFSYGLVLELFIEQDEYLELLSHAAGLRFIIHDQKDMPFPEDDGVNIPPGQESDLAIVKVHVRRLKAPYASKCSNGDGIQNYYRDAYKVGYTREVSNKQYYMACKKTCGQMHIINNCGCGMWEFPVPKGMNVPFCNITNKDINRCVQIFEDMFAHDELDCSCPLQCEEEIFELTLSSSQWPSAVYMAIDLVSGIGGLVGLWIGVSICTVAEFLELLLNVIIFTVKKRLIRKNKKAPLNPYMIAHQTFKPIV